MSEHSSAVIRRMDPSVTSVVEEDGYAYAKLKRYLLSPPSNVNQCRDLVAEERPRPMNPVHLATDLTAARLRGQYSPCFLSCLSILLNLSQDYVARLFENSIQPTSEGYGIYAHLDGRWRLCMTAGKNWLSALHSLAQRSVYPESHGRYLKLLTGSPCKEYDLAVKGERLLSTLTKRENDLSEHEQVFLIGSQDNGTNVLRVLGVKNAGSEAESPVLRMRNQLGQEFFIKWEDVNKEFVKGIIFNTSLQYYHTHLAFERSPREQNSVFSAILAVREDAVGVFSVGSLKAGEVGKLTITVYYEIEKNKFVYLGRISGTETAYFLNYFKRGNYLFFLEGLSPLCEYVLTCSCESMVKVRPGYWLASSKMGFEDMKRIFLPMFDEERSASRKTMKIGTILVPSRSTRRFQTSKRVTVFQPNEPRTPSIKVLP